MRIKKDFKTLITEYYFFRKVLEKRNMEVDDVDYQMVQTRLGEISRNFPNKISFIFESYFGLNGKEVKSLKEIADNIERSSTLVKNSLCKGIRRIEYDEDVLDYIIGISNMFPEEYLKKDFGFYYSNIQNTVFYGDVKQATKENPIYYYNIPQVAYGRAYMVGNSIYYDEAFFKSDVNKIKEIIDKMNGNKTKEEHIEMVNREKKRKVLERSIDKKKEMIKKLQDKIASYKQEIIELEEEKLKIEEKL